MVPVLEEVQAVVPASDVVPLAKPVKSSSQKTLIALAETVTACWALQPLAGFVTVTVYVPAAHTVGFCEVEVKPLGPLQLYVAPLTLEVALILIHEPQARAPPVAVITGAVLFSVTTTLADPVPVLLVATTV